MTKHTPATPLQALDAVCNAGFRKLDELKAAGKEGTHEYMQALYALRDLTRSRVQA
jgi:hypothetical protein